MNRIVARLRHWFCKIPDQSTHRNARQPSSSRTWCLLKLAYLTEVAALMAAHSRLFVEQPDEVPAQTIGDYYILSRNRFNRWMKDLNDLEHGTTVRSSQPAWDAHDGLPATRSLVEEILINEMLARIWTMLLLARDCFQGIDRVRPVAHNVFLGHLSVRHKALGVLLSDRHVKASDLSAVDRIRRATERWTDMLCCPLMDDFDLWQYAFHEPTAREFLEERVDQSSIDPRNRAWVLVLAGMRHCFPDEGGLAAPAHDDDRRRSRLMLNSFPEHAPEMTFWMRSRVHEARIAR